MMFSPGEIYRKQAQIGRRITRQAMPIFEFDLPAWKVKSSELHRRWTRGRNIHFKCLNTGMIKGNGEGIPCCQRGQALQVKVRYPPRHEFSKAGRAKTITCCDGFILRNTREVNLIRFYR